MRPCFAALPDTRRALRSLEMAAKEEPEPWFLPTNDKTIINLEHVLPKKPEGNWPSFTLDEVDLYVNRLTMSKAF